MLHLKKAFIIYLFLNLSIYLYIWKFHRLIPLNEQLYKNSAYHYYHDERFASGKFDLLRVFGIYDAQWYLKIAGNGYPKNPDIKEVSFKLDMERLSFAFFPLYPLTLFIFNLAVGYLELTAFLLSHVLLMVNFLSLYFFVSGLFSESLAFKTVFLIFFFPFSLFFRSYYTEGLFLLLLIWYSYFMIKKSWVKASLFQGLLAVTRPTGLFLIPLTLIFLSADLLRKKKNSFSFYFVCLLFIFVFFGFWLLFNYQMTGNYLFWKEIQSAWFFKNTFYEILKHNYLLLKSFVYLPLHDIHASKIDLLTFYSFGWLIILSLSFLKKELWWISFLMWIIPVLLRDTTSISRFQIVSFPVFIFLASKLNKTYFALVSAVFYSATLYVSLYFINWYWLG